MGQVSKPHWQQRDVDRVTPPQVLDIRGRAILDALNRLTGQKPISSFYVRDADICPTEALPALIAEYSLEEFIEPGLPEHVVRGIIKHQWFLHEGKGYDPGVLLGLSLLGMKGEIEHWHQVEPKRAANTHDITFYIGEQLFENTQAFFGEREIRAAHRMINATKRHSQASTTYVGAALRPNPLRMALNISGVSVTRCRMCVIQQTPRMTVGLSASVTLRSISLTRARLAA